MVSAEEAEKLIYGELLLRAKEARDDFSKFFTFVMREERTQNYMTIAPHQAVFFDFVMKHPKSVLMIPVQHAKCHGAGTPILMADGSIRAVETLTAGDKVMGPLGPKTISSVSSGEDELYRVIPVKGGSPFVVNSEHMLTLIQTETDKITDISVREYLSRSNWFRADHKLLRSKVSKFEGERSIGIDPYFLGIWFGDGGHHTRQIRLTNIDPEVREACRQIADHYGLVVTPNDEQSFTLALPGGKAAYGQDIARGGSGRNPLLEMIREVVGPSLSMDRIRTAPFEERLEFLAGFFDADGGMKDKCLYASQKRSDWTDTIEFLARSVGLGVTRGTYNHPKHGVYHRLCLYGETSILPLRVARKKCGARTKNCDALRTGFKLEAIGRGKYYGFTIGGDGRYLLGDFTITHNTFSSVALILYLLGRNPLMRGAIISATENQAQKPLSAVRSYVSNSDRLHMVFPNLLPLKGDGESWNQSELVIQRPGGIRDKSLVASHYKANKIWGSRLSFLLFDDIVDMNNSDTPEKRKEMYSWVGTVIESRLDFKNNPRVVFCNTAWYPEDTTHMLIEAGWPALIMRADGDILIKNAPNWDSPLIRPRDQYSEECRLVAHDPDPDNEVTLWPEMFDREAYENKRLNSSMGAVNFNRSYLNICRDDDTAMCKLEYIDTCKALARAAGYYHLNAAPTQSNVTFMGVDLAFAEHSKADDTAIFIFEVLADGKRLILDVDSGKWDTPTVIDKIAEKAKRYNATVMVEDNGAQRAVVQMLRRQHSSVVVTGYTTNHQTKANPQYGLPIIFDELRNGLWLIPNDQRGHCDKHTQKFIDQCLHYEPSKHTGDVLMAAFFARHKAWKFGALAGVTKDTAPQAGIASRLMAR